MRQMQPIIVLSFWDILQYEAWDKICVLKGFDDDFVFDSIYENEYEFELTADELKQLGISQKAVA